jgi:hypothetical protein
MKNRRSFLLALTAGLISMAVVVGPAIAEELLGVITKVDVAGKKLTVVERKTDKEVEITTTDDTEYVTKKGSNKINLERVAKQVAKIQEAGKKGINVRITHEKGVASKIAPAAKKKAAN